MKDKEDILKALEENYLKMPYNKSLWLRLEFAVICQDEIEALIVRMVEYAIEGERQTWLHKATDLANAGKPVPPEPVWWVSFSYRQIMVRLYGVVKNEKTIIQKMNSLVNDQKYLLRRQNPENPYGSPQYTINKEIVQAKLDQLPPLADLVTVAKKQAKQGVPVIGGVPADGTGGTSNRHRGVPADGTRGYQQMVPNNNSNKNTDKKNNKKENSAPAIAAQPSPSLSLEEEENKSSRETPKSQQETLLPDVQPTTNAPEKQAARNDAKGAKQGVVSKTEQEVELDNRRRYWQDRINSWRGKPLPSKGQCINETDNLKKLVAEYTDAQIDAIVRVMLTLFPFNKDPRSIGGKEIYAKSGPVSGTLKDARAWPADNVPLENPVEVTANTANVVVFPGNTRKSPPTNNTQKQSQIYTDYDFTDFEKEFYPSEQQRAAH